MKKPPWPRLFAVLGVTLAVLTPLGLVVYQSFLSAPFFSADARPSLEAYRFVWSDPAFLRAFGTSVLVAAGMVTISVPIGSMIAFWMVRADLPGRSWLEPCILVPIFLSPIVLAFGYVVAAGPVGFFSLWVKDTIGFVPWNIYSLASLVVIAGLSHVPHVYLYTSTALRTLNPELEEAARSIGAGPGRVALTVSLPLVWPAIVYSGALVFLLGFELFGLPLVLADPAGVQVLTTYLYKLTNLLGVPSYQLMAVVAITIVLISLPLVFAQRALLSRAGRYVTVRGRGQAVRPQPLGRWRWPAFGLVMVWLAVTVLVPVSGVVLRSVVRSWGEGVRLTEVLTLSHFPELLRYPNLARGVLNTMLIATVGGALAVAAYTGVALAAHRWRSGLTGWLDYLVMVPRSIPGLVVGLAFLWVFLFFRPLVPLKATLVSLWIAYSVVWLAYGLRLISAALLQLAPELEEAARVTGARGWRVRADVTLPLIRYGLIGSWLLIFMMFVREYSTGVYLLGPGTEVIGSLIVSLLGTGGLDLIAALSVVNIALVGVALFLALRLGVRLHA